MMITYIFRILVYPVLAEIDGKVIAGVSENDLTNSIKRIPIFEKNHYDVTDSTGEVWILSPRELVMSPLSFKKNRTKRELIKLVNSRTNKSENESPYSLKSISAKRYETIFKELVSLLKS